MNSDSRIQILVEEGVDLEPKDSRGQTPLHLAARNGSAKIVKVTGLLLSCKDETVRTETHLQQRRGGRAR